MANYATLIAAIQSVITQNGNNEITGPILQQTLISVVNSLGSGYQFIGIATPETTPGTPDQKVFYIGSAGTYPNFGPSVVPSGYMGIFYYDTDWHFGTVAFPVGDATITTQKLADNSVTRDKLASTLAAILFSYGYKFMGKADTGTTPGTPDQQVAYLAGPGTYQNFNSLVVPDGYIGIFLFGNNQWSVENIPLSIFQLLKSSQYSSKYINKTNGQLVDGAVSSYVYEYTGIVPGNKYIVSGYTGGNANTCLGAFYKSDGTFISSFVPSTGTATNYSDVEVTAPSECGMIRVFGSTSGNAPQLSASVKTVVSNLINTCNSLQQSLTDLQDDLFIEMVRSAEHTSKYIDKTTGELVDGVASSYVYDFLGINPGGLYLVGGRVGSTLQTCLGAFYKADGTFISSFVPSTGTATDYNNVPVVAPADCGMIRVFGSTLGNAPYLGSFITTVVSGLLNTYNSLQQSINELFLAVGTQTKLVPVQQYNSQYINKTTGELVNGYLSSYVTEYNITDPTKQYFASGRIGANTDTCLVAYYTNAGVFISSQFGSSGTAIVYTKEQLTVPSNCRKIRVFGYSSGGTTYPAELYVGEALAEKVTKIESQIKCKNIGKTVGVFGGSLSVYPESQTAKDIWREKLGLDITDYGVGGAGFSSLQGTSIQQQVNGATSKDIFILWASTNDFRNNRLCGEWTDYTVKDNYDSSKLVTQCGGINYCIKKLLEINPNAEIYFFTSLRFFSMESGYNPFSTETNSTGKTFAEYVEAQKKCCEYYGIPILDQYNLQGVNIFNYTQYYKTDNLHMNNAGYLKIGYVQAEFLSNGK